MKKQKSIPSEFAKTTSALFGYSVAPVFLSLILLFMPVNRWLRLGLGIAFLLIAIAFLFNGGANLGKYAHKHILKANSDQDDKHAKFMAWQPSKGIWLTIPYLCIVMTFLLLSMISGPFGGVFRILIYITFTPTALFAVATVGVDYYMQITWAGFAMFFVTAIVYVTIYYLGYILKGLRLRRNDADMLREIKSFDF
ncbi:MAG: hypothetical protein FWC80_07740 [Firmicutes bacterium]|nr:hypothetical protein [Bacillota bacterium]